MSSKADKLKALSAQLGLKTGAEITAPSSPPSKKTGNAPARPGPEKSPALDSLRAKLGLMTGADLSRERVVEYDKAATGAYEIDRVLRGEVVGKSEEGAFFLVRRDYPLDYAQGVVSLGAALESNAREIAFSASDSELDGFDPRKALFIDTETTGLAGGAGTVAFLIGVGYFHGDGFRLDQCFMRDYDDEEPMLRFLGELARDFHTVVSYNGKSFDLPLLRTRFIQNRISCSFDGLSHYDLVHAARRFWRRRLQDCSLGNIEREVLGVRRVGDVPGHLIPRIYFDYLSSRDARSLEGGFYHHQMDILSLVSLTGWISRCLTTPNGFDHAEDRLSRVRMHFRQKNYAEVVTHGRRFLDSGEGDTLRRECLEMLGMAHKRLRQWEDMRNAFERLLREFPRDITARLELAKLHEHRTRDLGEACRLCEEGLQQYHTQRALGRPAPLPEEAVSALQFRLARIKRKLARGRDAPIGLTEEPDTGE